MNRKSRIKLSDLQILVQVGPKASSGSPRRGRRFPDSAVVADKHGGAIGAKGDRVHVHVNGVSRTGDVVARDFRPSCAAVRRTDQRAIVCGATYKDIVRADGANGHGDVIEALRIADSTY